MVSEQVDTRGSRSSGMKHNFGVWSNPAAGSLLAPVARTFERETDLWP